MSGADAPLLPVHLEMSDSLLTAGNERWLSHERKNVRSSWLDQSTRKPQAFARSKRSNPKLADGPGTRPIAQSASWYEQFLAALKTVCRHDACLKLAGKFNVYHQ